MAAKSYAVLVTGGAESGGGSHLMLGKVSPSALAMIDLCLVLSLRMIALGKMNRRDMLHLRELIERIDSLLKEYLRASNPDQLMILEVEITADTEKLKRTAASLID